MKKNLFILMVISLLFSCTNKLYVANEDFEKKHLPFIIDSKTSREEIILKLGEPSWVFENGRIFTYRLSIDHRGNIKPVRIDNNKNDPNFSYYSPPAVSYYSLVAVFSDKGILEKHSLLLTNP